VIDFLEIGSWWRSVLCHRLEDFHDFFSFIPSGQADASGFRGALFNLFLCQSSTELDVESDIYLIYSKHEMLYTHNSLQYCAQTQKRL